MTRAPDWSVEEFEILLNHNNLSRHELAKLFPRRTSDPVEVVRQGIHRLHDNGDGSLLSEVMRRRLANQHQSLSCPVCGTRLEPEPPQL
jgi:hypothetical protein